MFDEIEEFKWVGSKKVLGNYLLNKREILVLSEFWTPKATKRVIFASAKMVGGASMWHSNALFVRTLKFRGAFPYPVIIKILIISVIL